MKITLYELLGLIKDYNAPDKIEYEGIIYELDKNIMNYWYKDGRRYLFEGYLSHLNDIVTILPNFLNDEEREYLRAVIKPFRDQIEYIVKYRIPGEEYIKIVLRDLDAANLPAFSPGSMYTGMESDKEYTVEELGL